MMKIIFAGVGGAFAPAGKGVEDEYGVWHSNILVEKDGKYLAIDLGGDARHSLAQLGVKLQDIEAAYLSHTHGDHVYGFEWFGLMKYFTEIRPLGRPRPLVFGARDVLERAWNQALSASLETIENFREANMTTFFEVHPFDPQKPEPFIWRGIEFTPIQTVHVMSGTKIQPSWGLLIREEGVAGLKILVTTDTQFASRQLVHFYGWANVIFHDCETSPFKSNVHAHFDDLKTLPEETRRKMWLYHYQPNPPREEAEKVGFQGFVRRGQVFVFNEEKKP